MTLDHLNNLNLRITGICRHCNLKGIIKDGENSEITFSKH